MANWVKEQERIDAERAEAEASFKYKTFDMGDTIESQQNEEDKELEEFLSTENEFKSETEGPTNATDDPMAKYFALGNLFVTFKEG